MRIIFSVALVLPAAAAVSAQAPPPRPFDLPTLGAASVGADDSGRRALCDELERLAADPDALFEVPGGGELSCLGAAVDRVAVRSAVPRSEALQTACRLAELPAPVVFNGMRPFPLNRRAPPSDPLELQLTLERLGVRTFGGVLDAFGFAEVVVRSSTEGPPAEAVGVHELPLACRHPA